jgi:NitT/TauT family transport system substrate-binding protein
MPHRRLARRAWCALALVAVLLALVPTSPPVSTGASAAEAAPLAQARRVTIGYVPNAAFAPVFVAYEKGYYREQGLDVTLEPLTGGADMATQTAVGNFDVGTGGPGAGLFNALARGINIVITAPVSVVRTPNVAQLVASRAAYDRGEVRSIADLRGKRVSIIARGAANDYYLDQALRRGGLTIWDIDLQVLPSPEAVAALANDAIPAALIVEPFATEAVNRGVGVLLTDDYLENFIAIVMYFNEQFARQRREDGIGVVTALYKAARDLDPVYRDEDVAIIAQYTRLSPEVIRTAGRAYHDVSGDLHLADIEELQRFVMARGEANYSEPLDLARYVDPSFSEAALTRLGPR